MPGDDRISDPRTRCGRCRRPCLRLLSPAVGYGGILPRARIGTFSDCTTTFDHKELDNLPEAVQRYLRTAPGDGQPVPGSGS